MRFTPCRVDAVRAIGVAEIQCGRGHRYLTLVYQIEAGCQRLLWVGKERTRERPNANQTTSSSLSVLPLASFHAVSPLA